MPPCPWASRRATPTSTSTPMVSTCGSTTWRSARRKLDALDETAGEEAMTKRAEGGRAAATLAALLGACSGGVSATGTGDTAPPSLSDSGTPAGTGGSPGSTDAGVIPDNPDTGGTRPAGPNELAEFQRPSKVTT